MTEKENENNETELNCSIVEITNNNYTLQCEGENNVTYNLNNAMSIIENEILIISFDNNTNNKIIFESTGNADTKSNYKYYFAGRKTNLSGGAIVAIILSIVLVLVALVFTYIYLSKRGTKREKDSTYDGMNIKI